MARKLQIKRGPQANLPSLAEGELGFTTDQKKVYVGHTDGNIELMTINNIVNRLDSDSTYSALSAKQGKVLSQQMEQKADKSNSLIPKEIPAGVTKISEINESGIYRIFAGSTCFTDYPSELASKDLAYGTLSVFKDEVGYVNKKLQVTNANASDYASYEFFINPESMVSDVGRQIATTNKIDILSLPFVSGVTDFTDFGQRTFYQKDSFGNVYIMCQCRFSNAGGINQGTAFIIATMPVGYRPKMPLIVGEGHVILNGDASITQTTPVGITIENNGIVAVSGLNSVGTNHWLLFNITYPTT